MAKKVQTEGTEQDARVLLLNTLLTSPHRDIKAITKFHTECMSQDINFYAHLAVWYRRQSNIIRDHVDAFIAHLFKSPVQEHRDAAFMMLQDLPVHQVIRVFSHLIDNLGGYPKAAKKAAEVYIRKLENNPTLLNAVLLKNRKNVKNLVKGLHFYSDTLQKVLFEGEKPEGSVSAIIAKIAEEESPDEQAKLIVKNKIPYTTAVGLVRQMTPAVWVALITQMTPQELLNNMQSIERNGLLDNEDIAKLVTGKLEKSGGKKVAALKTTFAKSTTMSADVVAAIDKVSDQAIKNSGQIKRPTALLLDTSVSMEKGVEIGKRIAAAISACCTSDFYMYNFDVFCTEWPTKGKTLADYEKDFKHLKLGGSTAAGAPIVAMTKKRQKVEQVIIVTDEGENGSPLFAAALEAYEKELGVKPDVVIVRINGNNTIERSLKAKGFNVDVWVWDNKGDYYSIPNIINMLAKGSKLDLVMDIMDTPLPRKPKRLDVLYRPK